VLNLEESKSNSWGIPRSERSLTGGMSASSAALGFSAVMIGMPNEGSLNYLLQ